MRERGGEKRRKEKERSDLLKGYGIKKVDMVEQRKKDNSHGVSAVIPFLSHGLTFFPRISKRTVPIFLSTHSERERERKREREYVYVYEPSYTVVGMK